MTDVFRKNVDQSWKFALPLAKYSEKTFCVGFKNCTALMESQTTTPPTVKKQTNWEVMTGFIKKTCLSYFIWPTKYMSSGVDVDLVGDAYISFTSKAFVIFMYEFWLPCNLVQDMLHPTFLKGVRQCKSKKLSLVWLLLLLSSFESCVFLELLIGWLLGNVFLLHLI